MVNWKLDDAVKHQLIYPYTFFVPSEETIHKLNSEDVVKLIFLIIERDNENVPHSERMWVKIISREDDNFVGRLENKPIHIKELDYGSEIRFNKVNICSTYVKDDEVRKSEKDFISKYTLVSKDVLVKKYFNFMMKENPKEENDTGWVFFTGFEDDLFISDLSNFKVMSLGYILNLDDAILTFLYDEPPCAYERSFLTGMLEKIENMDIEDKE
jgi:hypothetical protein